MDDKRIRKKLLAVYERLIAYYGPQEWWPADEPFEVIIGAILTQSTAWTNVEKAIKNLKATDSLSPQSIRKLSHAELAGRIRPSGYFNAKAKKLLAFMQWLEERYGDNLQEMFSDGIGHLREQLLAIYGIGDETADSILLYAANKPIFVIDAYTRRFIKRIGLAPENNTYASFQALFMDNLPSDTRLFNEYHALLVRLAKDVCRKNPICEECCLNTSAASPSVNTYPCSLTIQQHS